MSRRLKNPVDKYEAVLITHKECGNWWFWAVDMPGVKNDIKHALYTAAQQGDTVTRLAPGETIIGSSCRCFMGTAS